MVQLIRLAVATARGQNSALNTTSYPADFTVNIQNNITVSKNASVALKGLTFSTNDGVYIQTPIGLNVGVSSQLGTTQNVTYKYGAFPAGKILLRDVNATLFNALLGALDFNQLDTQTYVVGTVGAKQRLTRGFYLEPSLDKDNKLIINFNCDPANEVDFFNNINSTINALTIYPAPTPNDLGATQITANTPEIEIDAGECYCIGKKKLIMGSFQYKVNLENFQEDNKYLNNDFIVGLVAQSNINKTAFLKDDYYCCVYPVTVNQNAYYAVYFNGQETISSVQLNKYDIVYWVMENGKVKCYIETRNSVDANTRNGSINITQDILIPYAIDFNNASKSGFFPCATLLNINTKFLNTAKLGEFINSKQTKLGGSYYISSPTQSIDNNGKVVDYGLNTSPDDNLLKANETSLSGDVFERSSCAVNISFENGLWSVFNTNLRIFSAPNAISSSINGNGAIKLALYGDVVVELLNFDLSSYNSNYPDRKSILYVIERLDEIGATSSNIYSFDVNYPIFLNIFNRDDITVNSFQIRITKDGVPLNLTGGATLTLLIDG